VHHQVGLRDAEGIEQIIEGVGVEVEVVAGVEGFVGEAVAWEVEGDDAVGFGQRGDDVAVEVGAGWEAVEEEDWVALACFEAVKAEAADLGVVTGRLGHRAMVLALRG
jgi:hypothetical protein